MFTPTDKYGFDPKLVLVKTKNGVSFWHQNYQVNQDLMCV